MLRKGFVFLGAAAALAITFALVSLGSSPDSMPTSAAIRTSSSRPASLPVANPGPASDVVGIGAGGLTGAQEAETLAFLKRRRPSYRERLIAIRSSDPSRYGEALRKMFFYMMRRRKMPEIIRRSMDAEREAQVDIVAIWRRMHEAPSVTERAKLVKQLGGAISDHFEIEQNLRGYRLSELEKEITQLRGELDSQWKQRDQIIADRLQRWLKAAAPTASTQPSHK